MKKPRKVELVKFATGERVEADSVAEFCKKVNLSGNEKFHFTPLLEKKNLHFKGWVLPETYEAISKKLNWQDQFGNDFENLSVLDIMEKMGETRFTLSIRKFLAEETAGFNGLFLKSKAPDFLYQPRAVEQYTLVKGKKKFVGKNKIEVAEKAGISSKSVWAMERGRYASVCGVSIESIKLKSRSVL